jgi:hypothetical protein
MRVRTLVVAAAALLAAVPGSAAPGTAVPWTAAPEAAVPGAAGAVSGCPSGLSSSGTIDTDGTGGQATPEPVLAHLEGLLRQQVDPALTVASRRVRRDPDRAESVLLTADGTVVGRAAAERFPDGGWQPAALWFCSG